MDFSYNGLALDRYERGTSNGTYSEPDTLRYYNYNAQNTNYDSPNGEYPLGTVTMPSGHKSKHHPYSQPVWWLVNVFPGTDRDASNITNFNNWFNPETAGQVVNCLPLSNTCSKWLGNSALSCPPPYSGFTPPPYSNIFGVAEYSQNIPNAVGPNPGWTGTPITVASTDANGHSYGDCNLGSGFTYPKGFGGRWSFALVACCGNKNSDRANTDKGQHAGEPLPNISDYVDLSWDILGPAQDTVNIFDVSLN